MLGNIIQNKKAACCLYLYDVPILLENVLQIWAYSKYPLIAAINRKTYSLVRKFLRPLIVAKITLNTLY